MSILTSSYKKTPVSEQSKSEAKEKSITNAQTYTCTTENYIAWLLYIYLN